MKHWTFASSTRSDLLYSTRSTALTIVAEVVAFVTVVQMKR